MINATDFLDDFHAARAEALQKRMDRSHQWWAEYLQCLNDRTESILYRKQGIMLWIAQIACAITGVFYR